jgi:hypothetical protein
VLYVGHIDKIMKPFSMLQSLVNIIIITGSDKIVSLIPYLLPLCDALPYAKMFIQVLEQGIAHYV